MKIVRKIVPLVLMLWVLVLLFNNCKGPKEITGITSQVKEDTLTHLNKQDTALASKNLVTRFACLPQDKPFLDSLTSKLFNKMNVGYEETFTLVDTVPALIRKLLPNVIFYNNVLWIKHDSRPYLCAYVNKIDYRFALTSFNYLIKESNMQKALLEDKIAALLYMHYGFKSEIEVLNISPCNLSFPYDNYTYNTECLAVYNGIERKWAFTVKDNQILCIRTIDTDRNIYFRTEIYETPL